MSTLLAVLVDGIIYASWLFIIAAGLTMIYGVMRILNMAHGSLYALGAYAAASLAGAWLSGGHAPLGSYAMLVLAAILVGLVMGPLIERGLLRFFYGRDEVVLVLVTYALFLILEDVIKLVWGVESYFVTEPYGLLGNFELGDLSYPIYSLVLVLAAILAGLALRFGIYGTRYGKLLVAVIHDREVSAAMGINVNRVYLVTFTPARRWRRSAARSPRRPSRWCRAWGSRSSCWPSRWSSSAAWAACPARRSAPSSSGWSAPPPSTSSPRSSSSASTS